MSVIQNDQDINFDDILASIKKIKGSVTNLEPGKIEYVGDQMYNAFFKDIFFSGNRAIQHNWVSIGTHGDGSCFLHSCCLLLDIRNYSKHSNTSRQIIGHDLRQIFTRAAFQPVLWNWFWKLPEQQKLFSQNIIKDLPPDSEEIFVKLSKISEWSDIYIIYFVMKMLGINCLFLNTITHDFYCGVHDKYSEITILIEWVDGCHFQAVGYQHSDGTIQTIFRKNSTDDNVVDIIMKRYKESCTKENIEI